MIRISQLKLDVGHTEADLKTKICRVLRIKDEAILSYTRKKQSLDAVSYTHLTLPTMATV